MKTYAFYIISTVWLRISNAQDDLHNSECNVVNFENCENEYFDFDVLTGYEFYHRVFIKTIEAAGFKSELPSDQDQEILDPMTYTFICVPYNMLPTHRYLYRSLSATQEEESANFSLLNNRMKHGGIVSTFHSYLVLKRTAVSSGDYMTMTLHAKYREGNTEYMGIDPDSRSLHELFCRIIIRDAGSESVLQVSNVYHSPPYWETDDYWKYHYWRHYNETYLMRYDGWYTWEEDKNTTYREYQKWDRRRWNYERMHNRTLWNMFKRWTSYYFDVTVSSSNAQVMLYCRYAYKVAYVIDHFRYVPVGSNPSGSPYCEPYTGGPKSPNPDFMTTMPPFEQFVQGVDWLGDIISPFVLLAGTLAAFSSICIAAMLCFECTRMKNRCRERRFNKYCECLPVEMKAKLAKAKRKNPYSTEKDTTVRPMPPKCMCGT